MKNSSSGLGLYLRDHRIEMELTLHKVSKEVDIDSPMLSKIERGQRLPTNEQLSRLCQFYKVSETDLKVMQTAEKIIREYGVNDTTYNAVMMVCEQLVPYVTKNKSE